jgi:hypothetical protein
VLGGPRPDRVGIGAPGPAPRPVREP